MNALEVDCENSRTECTIDEYLARFIAHFDAFFLGKSTNDRCVMFDTASATPLQLTSRKDTDFVLFMEQPPDQRLEWQ